MGIETTKGDVIPYQSREEFYYNQRMKKDGFATQTSRAFAKQVDLNLINMDATGYEYIARLLEGVYHAVGAGADICTNVDYILRVEYQVKSCSIFECKRILHLLDEYLAGSTISKSREKGFITHTRNKVFEQHEKLRDELKK